MDCTGPADTVIWAEPVTVHIDSQDSSGHESIDSPLDTSHSFLEKSMGTTTISSSRLKGCFDVHTGVPISFLIVPVWRPDRVTASWDTVRTCRWELPLHMMSTTTYN